MMAPEYFCGDVLVEEKRLPWVSTFSSSVGFECVRCGFCCYGRIGLTSQDIKNLELQGLADLVDHSTPPHPGTPYEALMRVKPDNTCISLAESSLCSIYSKRPMVCRCFPFMLSPSYNNDAVVDVLLRCPYVDISPGDLSKAKRIRKSALDAVASDYAKNVPRMILNTLDYYRTLVAHVQATVPAAFFPREKKLNFMHMAIDRLSVEDGNNLTETAKNWSEAVARASHTILLSDLTEYEQMPSPKEMLSGLSYDPGAAGVSKRRLKEAVVDFKNTFIYPGRSSIKASYLSAGFFGVKLLRNEGGSIVSKKIGFDKLARLSYSEAAVGLFREYLRILVNRSTFQYCIARCAAFLTDFARIGATDFELETAVLANAVAANIDPMSRLVAASSEKSEIDEEAMRFAISNVDIALIPNLANDSIASKVVSAVMRDSKVFRRKRIF